MINTDKTFCTYENIYYEMWEIAGRYTEIAQFQVIGKSHDDRMIPMVQIGKGAETVFCIAGLSGRDRCMATLRDKLFISDNRSHLLQIKKAIALQDICKNRQD